MSINGQDANGSSKVPRLDKLRLGLMTAEPGHHPSLPEFRQLTKQSVNLIPVFQVYSDDLATPVSVYLKLVEEGRPSFLLESVEGGEVVGRYSFVGVNSRNIISMNGSQITETQTSGTNVRSLAEGKDFLDVLKAELGRFTPAKISGLPRFVGGAVGYLGYDLISSFEHLPKRSANVLNVPDALFILAETLVIFDHVKHRLIILSNAHVDGDAETAYEEAVQRIEAVREKLTWPLPATQERRLGNTQLKQTAFQPNMSQEQYEELVDRVKEYISSGHIYQLVLSQRLSKQTNAHPFAVYRTLRRHSPSPYMFYIDFGEYDLQLIGASPNMHARLEGNIASIRVIAGTRKRGNTRLDDLALEEELLADSEERARHVTLLDVARNDLGRVSEYGTVQTKSMMIAKQYSRVIQMVSDVQGKLKPGLDAYDLMRATFPSGAITGVPKIRAMEIIEELENERRGPYAGAVGFFGYDGNMDSCITLRTILMQGDNVYIQAGANIVANSDPTRECYKCLVEAYAVAVAIENVEQGVL